MLFGALAAGLALNEAAPVELALTLPGPVPPVRVVTTTAAEEATAVGARRSPVASSARGAERASVWVPLAVTW